MASKKPKSARNFEYFMRLYHRIDALVKIVVNDNRFTVDDLERIHTAQDVFFSHAIASLKTGDTQNKPCYRYSQPHRLTCEDDTHPYNPVDNLLPYLP